VIRQLLPVRVESLFNPDPSLRLQPLNDPAGGSFIDAHGPGDFLVGREPVRPVSGDFSDGQTFSRVQV
jgi:hypothetical protein